MRDVRALDLNLLRALDVLLDERSVTRAADRLALTQPAVSGMLARLRESFEDPLFVRGRRGVVPTLRALELAEPVKRILAEAEALLQPVRFDPASASFTLTLAATDYALEAIVAPFVTALRARAPGVVVRVRPLDDDQILDQFERGAVDLAFMTPDSTPGELHARPLFDEAYVCALRADHPDATSSTLSLDRFCALDHALVSYSGEPFQGVTDVALAATGRQRRVALSVTSFLILLKVLRTTDLIAVAPKRLLADAEGLVFRQPPVPIPGFTKVAAWHERTHRDQGHRWVRDLLFEVNATIPSPPCEVFEPR
ncbi:LysR family transcriptional regulator [Caulobacter sp. 602-2]|uniref:LysR family transcriptional regulator n=1 Tax=Caulobacter sp. 602-2 TaxID=2710887 RepID=A0A6G4QT51_9CAUL|nr:LysR family transcriptional regulator [Caulobacter sp. 602-2]NGM48435.1 LysR family transcriptional regulator [Caulobacter sp. 602-2]